MSPAGVWSVYNLLPSDVLPPLTTISVTASVQIDSEINGFIISAPAWFTPLTKPANKVLSSCSPAIILLTKVLYGLAITSYALLWLKSMYLNSPSSPRIGTKVEFLDQSGTNWRKACISSSVTSYKNLAPSTTVSGTTTKVVAIPVNLLNPVAYSGLSFLTNWPVSASTTYGVMLLPLTGFECFNSLIPCSAILVVVLIISAGNDMKLPIGNILAVLTADPTYA